MTRKGRKKEKMVTKKFYVVGKGLRITMRYDDEKKLTILGQYARDSKGCDERLEMVEYNRLLRKYGIVKPSVLGRWWDWVLDQVSNITRPMRPGKLWGPYEYEVGPDFKF